MRINHLLRKLTRRPKLIIFDDHFPVFSEVFKITEFNYYLEHLPDTTVKSFVFADPGNYQKYKSEYAREFPQFADRIAEFSTDDKYDADLAYSVFLNNAFRYLPVVEKMRIPFVFTLYAGGGFHLDQPDSDAKLKAVMGSTYFRKVIVSQKLSVDYLLKHGFCREDQIEFIFGAVEDSDTLLKQALPKQYYKKDKATFDICFVAKKYMPEGRDKGYDTFIEVAKQLAPKYPDMRFHVVGNFDETDIPVTEIKDKITFYGTQHLDFFPEFHSRMDMIISANVPFLLDPGAFDGFPTGCCKDAAILGVAVFASDPLGMNFVFKPEEEIVIIKNDVNSIVKDVVRYYQDPEKLYKLSAKGSKAFLKAFSIETQMHRRLKILKQFLFS